VATVQWVISAILLRQSRENGLCPEIRHGLYELFQCLI